LVTALGKGPSESEPSYLKEMVEKVLNDPKLHLHDVKRATLGQGGGLEDLAYEIVEQHISPALSKKIDKLPQDQAKKFFKLLQKSLK